MATDRDIIFAIVCTDVMNKRTNIRTHIMQYNSNCKTRCIISTSISNFSVYAYYQEGHFRLFWKFLLQLRCARYYQQGITVKVCRKRELEIIFFLVPCLFRETPIRKDKKYPFSFNCTVYANWNYWRILCIFYRFICIIL